MSTLTLPLTSRPFLSWEGEDSWGAPVGLEADHEGNFSYRHELEPGRWVRISNESDQLRALEAFVSDCMAKQAGVVK